MKTSKPKSEFVALYNPDIDKDKLRSMGVSLCAVLDVTKQRKDETYGVRLRITANRIPRMVAVGVSATKEEWKQITSLGAKGRPSNLQRICLDQLRKAGDILLEMKSYDHKEFINRFKGKQYDHINVWDAFDRQVDSLVKQDRVGYADTFRGSKQSFFQFISDTKKPITTFDHITVEWLNSYVGWGSEMVISKQGKKKRLSRSSQGIHLRNLRVLHNIALKSGEAKTYPFKNFKEPKAESNKRALSKTEIRSIIDYETDNDFRRWYRDLFVFSYQSCGMNLADIFRLRWGDVSTYPAKDGSRKERILFQRKKTSRKQTETKRSVLILKSMRRIMDKWGNPRITDDTYIFPTLNGRNGEAEIFKLIKQETRALNKHLKEICKELQIEGADKITSYAARHSYVTHAIHSGQNVAFVQERLGHADPRTTTTYIKSIDPELLEQSSDFVVGND